MSLIIVSWRQLMDALRLYGRYAGVSVRGQMQYKASFWLLSISQLLATSTEFVAIWALFARFGNLRGWALPEVALFYGLVNVSFAIADALSRGFDTFADMVKAGDFDRLLLRPRSTAFQVAARDILLTRVGRLLQGVLVLGWAVHALPMLRAPLHVLLITGVIAGGIALFCGLFILQAALSFWTVETLELMNILTYGSTEAGQFPLSIYRRWFREFFTFVVPLACINIVPVRVLLAANGAAPGDIVCAWLSPLAGFLFLAVSVQFWHVGVRRYTSTGS